MINDDLSVVWLCAFRYCLEHRHPMVHSVCKEAVKFFDEISTKHLKFMFYELHKAELDYMEGDGYALGGEYKEEDLRQFKEALQKEIARRNSTPKYFMEYGQVYLYKGDYYICGDADPDLHIGPAGFLYISPDILDSCVQKHAKIWSTDSFGPIHYVSDKDKALSSWFEHYISRTKEDYEKEHRK